MKNDKSNKLSFCTICMNRLHHLKQTLPQNMEDNKGYENLEYVVLDYNSKDGMEQWVKANFMEQIRSGRLVYYKNPYPEQFNMSHSKNMVSRLASGEIVCLVDADNYTGNRYARFVNNNFQINPNSFLTTVYKDKLIHKIDTGGRVCFRKTDFMSIQGFDESMNNYGFDDIDFANRLEASGKKRVILKNHEFLNAIEHNDDARIMNQKNYHDFQDLFVNFINPARSDLLFLFKDQTLNLGTVIESRMTHTQDYKSIMKTRQYKYQFILEKNKWLNGIWRQSHRQKQLFFDDGTEWKLKLNDGMWKSGSKVFHSIQNEEKIKELILFHSTISNRNKMIQNKKRKILSVNNGSFGRGMVYKNFDERNPISLK